VVPVDEIFRDLPAFVMRDEFDKLVHNGNPFQPEQAVEENPPHAGSAEGVELERVRVYDSQHVFIGIYEYHNEKKRYQPQKVFLGGI